MTFAGRSLRTCSPVVFAAVMLAVSAEPAMAGCQSGLANNTTTFPLSASGCQGNAVGTGATAVGLFTAATATWSTAFGVGAIATGANATVLGVFASADAAAGATTVGAFTGAGTYSTAIGGASEAPSSTRATGAYSIAIGGGNGANFEPGPPAPDIVIQLNGARATGFISTAIGTASQATGGGSSAFGLYSRAIGNDSAAFGEFSLATGANSIAMGLFSSARATAAIALGTQTIASGPGSVAIGNKSIATVANTVSVGSASLKRRIVNLAPAVASTDAVTLAQAKALIAAASGAAPMAQAQPADDIRRELAELRALVSAQQERIAKLEGIAAERVSAFAD